MATILVVDDREVNRKLLKTILNYAGYEVIEAADGEEALQRVKEEIPDLVITDILMPTMDGYELVRRLRDNGATSAVRVIFYTAAYLNSETETLARASGVSRILSKPAETEEIFKTVEEALRDPLEPVTIPNLEDYDRHHTRLLTDKLARKVEELEGEIKLRLKAEESMRKLSRKLLAVQEEERRRIALELHDEIGQSLTALLMTLRLAENETPGRNEQRISESRELVTDAIRRLRRLCLDLRPSILDDFGLTAAIENFVRRYTDSTGISVDLQTSGPCDMFDPDVQITIYRLVQESLTNVARHAQVREVTVKLQATMKGIHLEVSDKGRGFVKEKAISGGGSCGLLGMFERAGLVQGRLNIDTKLGRGTCIMADIPRRHRRGARSTAQV